MRVTGDEKVVQRSSQRASILFHASLISAQGGKLINVSARSNLACPDGSICRCTYESAAHLAAHFESVDLQFGLSSLTPWLIMPVMLIRTHVVWEG